MLLINLDISALVQLRDQLEPSIRNAMRIHGQRLTAATHAHILELAKQKLHSRRKAFEEGLTIFEAEKGVWVINLDKKARWIDDGMDEHEMIDDLLKSKKAKTGKDGSRYMSIPFDHSPGKGKTSTTPAQQDLASTIKAELKKRGIPFGKLETGPTGAPKLGTLHKFDIMKEPLKAVQGPGQGKGPIGQVRQGPTGIPFLQGITISQKKVKDKKTGKESVQRGIMTFRTVSSKMKGSGRWVHPGLKPLHMMDDGYRWAMREWESRISQDVLAEVVRGI